MTTASSDPHDESQRKLPSLNLDALGSAELEPEPLQFPDTRRLGDNPLPSLDLDGLGDPEPGNATRPAPPPEGGPTPDGATRFVEAPTPSPGSDPPRSDAPPSSIDHEFDTFVERDLGARPGLKLRGGGDDSGHRVGRYAVTGRLGEGGMGEVLEVLDDRLGRQVALKLIKDADRRALARFVQEARITGQLEHPNIVPVYELGVSGNKPFLTMKRVDGETLESILRELARQHAGQEPRPGQRAWTREQLLQAFLKICDALRFAHAHDVIHRDLKPDNVMIGEFGEVLVMDWGLGKVVGAKGSGSWQPTPSAPPGALELADPLKTRDGAIVGTPSYMPPEQANGELDKVDFRSDVFSLGAILFNILTLKRPYGGRSPLEVLARAGEARFRPPRVAAPELEIPWELEAVVMKAMARRRLDRYQTVDELREDVARFVEGRLLRAADYTIAQRLGRWVARHKLAIGAAVCAALLAGVLGWGALARMQRAARVAQLRADATQAAAAERWQEARDHATAALALVPDDAELGALAEQSKAELARETAAREAALTRAEVDRRVREQTAPVGRLVEQARPFFHIAGLDINRKLGELRAALERLETAVRATPAFGDHPLALGMLGSGRLVSGAVHRARDPLERALELLARPEWAALSDERELLRFRLAQLYLQRAMIADLTRASGEGRARARPWIERARPLLTDSALADEEQQLLARATLDVASGQPRAAAALAEDALSKWPRRLVAADLWLIKAWSAWEQDGRAEAAIAACDEAIAWRPHDAWAHALRAAFRWRELLAEARRGRDVAERQGQIELDLQRALAINPSLAPAHLLAGLIASRGERYPAAIKAYSAALEVEPDSAIAFYNRGNARYHAGELLPAIEDYTRAIELAPGYWMAQTNRGRANFDRKDHRAAAADFRAAIEAAPDAWFPRLSYARMLQQSRLAEAIKLTRQALERAKHPADRRVVQAYLDRLENR